VLRHLTRLLHLFVAENEIGMEGQEKIATMIHDCERIQSTDHIGAPVAGQQEWGLRNQIDLAYQISFVASCVRRHPLTALDVSMNGLGRFPASFLAFAATLSLVPTITDLDISDNGPCSERVCQTLARSIRTLSELQVLKLSNNSISGEGASALMCSIITLKELRLLELQHNLFHFAPCSLSGCCPNLQRLDLLYNPWLAPSLCVMEKKTYREIKEEMLALYKDSEINTQLVLGILGAEEVGKSSLISALTNESNTITSPGSSPSKSTRALEVIGWQPHGEDGPQFTIYDFSGLSVYHTLQEALFLPRRAMYCLVWRPFAVVTDFEYSDQNQAKDLLQNASPFYRVKGHGLITEDQLKTFLEKQIRPWIALLYNRLPGCFVLLVATHSDCTSTTSMQLQCNIVKHLVFEISDGLKLKQISTVRYPRFMFDGTSISISSQNGTGISELRETIISTAVNLPFFGELLPKSWIRALNALRAEASKSIVIPVVKMVKKREPVKCDLTGESCHHLVRFQVN
jgi:GTPase SAR1 family protein